MFITAIVLAAGKGLRLESKTAKPLVKVNSKPLIAYSLELFNRHPDIRDIIVVANRKNRQDLIRIINEYRIGKSRGVVLGGQRRQDSVLNGLKATDAGADMVLIHDSARPLINKTLISSLIEEARDSGAAIAAVPVKATIKRVRGNSLYIRETLNRDNLWEAQTPQVFKKYLLLKAYKKAGDNKVTDDASLVEKLGIKVKLVLGSPYNLKITTPEDLMIAEAIVKKIAKNSR